jgi:hypothetical protein
MGEFVFKDILLAGAGTLAYSGHPNVFCKPTNKLDTQPMEFSMSSFLSGWIRALQFS